MIPTQELYALYTPCFPTYPVSFSHFSSLLRPELGVLFCQWEEGQLVGFALIHQASLTLLCVDKNHRRQGIGTGLLYQAEQAISTYLVVHPDQPQTITLGVGPYYLLQGVPHAHPEAIAFFQNRGYTAQWSSTDMVHPLQDFSLQALSIPPPPAGYQFRFLTPDEHPALLEAVASAQPQWLALFSPPPDPVFAALDTQNRILGFALLNPSGGRFAGPSVKSASIGCVGVVSHARNQGIGRQLVAHSAHWLQSQGAQEIELRYVALVDWYRPLGFLPSSHQWMGGAAPQATSYGAKTGA